MHCASYIFVLFFKFFLFYKTILLYILYIIKNKIKVYFFIIIYFIIDIDGILIVPGPSKDIEKSSKAKDIESSKIYIFNISILFFKFKKE